MSGAPACIATREITEEISPGVGSPSPATLTDLSAAVARLSTRPDAVRSRLRYLCSHPDRLETVARQSYWHRNGFAKVKIVEGHGFCLRLHIWPAGEDRQGDVDPHGHRWEFASWVAVGPGLVETHFVETRDMDPDATAYARFDYGRVPGAGYLQPRGTAWLRQHWVRRREAGEVYSCSRDVLHTVAPTGTDLIATIVLQGHVLEHSTSVFRRDDHPTHSLEQPLTSDELYHLFGAVETALGEFGPR